MGYEPRPAEAVDHPLRCEALACDGDSGAWILVCADVLAFNARFTDLVRMDISHSTGLSPSSVIVTATHTHSGPNVVGAIWCEGSELESEYFRQLRSALAETAVRSWDSRSPGTLTHGRTIAKGIAHNRRVCKSDGTWTNEWADLDGSHTGYCDPAIDLIGVRRNDGTLDALLVNFGCHPVCFGGGSRRISGDYVSYLKDALEQSGEAGTVLFTVSGHGNIDPRACCQTDPSVVRDTGTTLADIISKALPDMLPVDGEGVCAVSEPWDFEANWDLIGRASSYLSQTCRICTTVAAWSAGSLAMVGFPGEVVSEYRELLRARSPFAQTILVSLANDFIGYLPTDEILDQGAYEARLCPLRPIQDALMVRADAALERAASGRADRQIPGRVG